MYGQIIFDSESAPNECSVACPSRVAMRAGFIVSAECAETFVDLSASPWEEERQAGKQDE